MAKKSKERIHEVATIRLACSEKAGKWLYEEDAFSVINNAIDLEEYTPDSGKREEMRSEFGLSQEETAILADSIIKKIIRNCWIFLRHIGSSTTKEFCF